MIEGRLRVGISEFQVAEAPSHLITYGLGSCLGIALYDTQNQRGALAHTLLPTSLPGIPAQSRAKFVDEAIDLMVDALSEQGTQSSALTAKLVGGATMFEALHGADKEPIGVRNTQAARAALQRRGIPIVAESVGGNYGRTLEFHLDSGRVMIRSVRGRNQAIEL